MLLTGSGSSLQARVIISPRGSDDNRRREELRVTSRSAMATMALSSSLRKTAMVLRSGANSPVGQSRGKRISEEPPRPDSAGLRGAAVSDPCNPPQGCSAKEARGRAGAASFYAATPSKSAPRPANVERTRAVAATIATFKEHRPSCSRRSHEADSGSSPDCQGHFPHIDQSTR